MKWSTTAGVFVLTSAILAGAAFAAEETAQNFQLKNRFRVGWDDNVYEVDKNKTDSFKVIEELEFLVNLDMEQTFFGLRYRPTFVWWDNRSPDDTDFQHEADLVFSHNFTPRLSLSAKDTLRIAQLPELIDRGTTTREKNDYTYNLADGVLGYKVSDPTRIELGVRDTTLRYRKHNVATNDDYDIYAVGVTLRHQLQRETALSAEARYEDTQYTDAKDRDANSTFLGGGLEQIFSPNLVGSLRAGWQHKEFDASGIGSEDSPYADVSLTYLPSPKTRVSLGAGYSLFEADVSGYANQDRTISFLTLSHDLTARIQLFLAGSYQQSKYHGDQTVGATSASGTEDIMQLSGRVSYMVNRHNYLEASVQYLDFNSEPQLRNDFDRTRVELGWRTQL